MLTKGGKPPVSVLSIFKNPIILLSLVSMGLFFGMPKLVENSKFLLLGPVRLGRGKKTKKEACY